MDDYKKLLELARETVKTTKNYPESEKNSIFDFRNESYFLLWVIVKDKEPEVKFQREYGSRAAKVCVGCHHVAARKRLLGKTIDREEFMEGVAKLFSSMNPGHVTPFLKSTWGQDILGYNNDKETVKIGYIPREVIL